MLRTKIETKLMLRGIVVVTDKSVTNTEPCVMRL